MFDLQLVLFLFFQVGAIIPLSTAATTTTTVTAITAVLAVIQVTSGYLPTTQNIFHDTKTFTVRGRAYRENWENFFTFDKGCLQVYIYMDSYNLLTEKRFSIGENVDYSINFNGIQGRKYIMRMILHKGKLCLGELQYSGLDVVHEGDYYTLTHEKIHTEEADADNVIWKSVVLTESDNGQCGKYYRCQCSEQCQLYSTGYYCTPRDACPYSVYPQWVCASDGQTYHSVCSFFTNRDCSNGRVYLVRKGKCSEDFTTPKWNEIDDPSETHYPSRSNTWSLKSSQGHLKIILGVFCPLIVVIIVLIFIRRRYVSRKKAAGSSYRRFPKSNPTSTSSSPTTYKFDHEFFVSDPVKYEQPGSERVITANVVYLEKDDYHTTENGTANQLE